METVMHKQVRKYGAAVDHSAETPTYEEIAAWRYTLDAIMLADGGVRVILRRRGEWPDAKDYEVLLDWVDSLSGALSTLGFQVHNDMVTVLGQRSTSVEERDTHQMLLDLEQTVLRGALVDSNADKSDWIRAWVKIRRQLNLPCGSEGWRMAYEKAKQEEAIS